MNLDSFNKQFDNLIIPTFIILSIFFTLTSIYNLTIQLEDLFISQGEVQAIRIEKEKSIKGRINSNFYVYLTSGERFKIMDDNLFMKYRQTIMDRIKQGDHVTIYRRTDLQTTFGLGTTNLIYQIEHEGQVLMPISVMKHNFKIVAIIFSSILIILVTIQYRKSRKKATDNNGEHA